MSPVEGIDHPSQDILAITGMHVIPGGAEGRMPWILLSMVVVKKIDPDVYTVTESFEIDVCGMVDIQKFIENRGDLDPPLSKCNLGSFFAVNKNSGYIPVSFPSSSIMRAQLMLVPTRPDFDLQLVEVSFVTSRRLGSLSWKKVQTPSTFTSNSKLPTRSAWSQFSRTMMLYSNTKLGSSTPVITQQGVAALSTRILSQNTMVLADFLSRPSKTDTITVFESNDPDSPTHWLTQFRIVTRSADSSAGKHEILLSDVRASHLANVQISVLHSCDRNSCLGCTTLRLQALCYASQQCSLARCVGTVVNQKYFLCDVGLGLQSLADQGIAQMLGAWLVFTETYSDVLKIALNVQDSR